MWSVWLVFCDCGFHSVCPLMNKDKRLVEASWWERLAMGKTGSWSGWQGHAQLSSAAHSFPTLCDPMDYSASCFPAHRQLPELAQTHVYWVGDAILTAHPLSPLLLLLSIFPSMRVMLQWVSSSHQVAKVLEFQLHGLVGSPCCPRDSQFKNVNYSALGFLYSPTLTSIRDYWKNHSFK